MFVQFIEGPVGDEEGLRRQHDRWHEELAPGAEGWLGTTAGITPDGTGFLAARFASEQAARANSERPEQGEWWAETEECFDGPVTFTDCSEVETFLEGGADAARFVQVIQGRVTDTDEALRLMAAFEELGPEVRPDVLGGYLGLHDDDAYTQVVYFTSEDEAREGEAAEAAGEHAELNEGLRAVHVEEPRFLDLPDPWLSSA